MPKKIIVLLTVFGVLTLSCNKDEWARNPSGLEANIVLVGGGCGAIKVIEIDQNITRRSVPQNSCVPQQAEVEQQTDDAVFQKLSRFVQTLNLQSNPIEDCWRCADGSDYIITLRNGSSTIAHSIATNTDVRARQEFIEFLNSL